MAVPGVWEENELKLLLKKLINSKDEVFKFAVAAKGPREGQLALDKKLKFKKKDVQEKAESDAKEEGGKPVKMEVMTGECRLDSKNNTTLLLLVNGKAPAKAVACIEHLLVRGPFKAIGFTGVILEEVDENVESSTTESPSGESESSGSESESPSSETESSSSESVTDAPSDEQAKWEKALADIEPSYLQGLSDRPGDASQFRAVMGFAQGKAETKDYKAAIAALQKLAELLKGKPKTEGTTADDPSALFNERLKALLPQIKAAAGTPAGDEAKLKASEAGVFGRKKDFAQANLLLDQVEKLLLKSGPTEKVVDPGALFNERLQALLPQIKAALGTPAGDEAKLKASEAGVFARKKDFPQANELLDLAESALKRSANSEQTTSSDDKVETMDGLGAENLERIAALSPQVKALLLAWATNAKKVGLAFSEAQALNRQKDFEGAKLKLDEVDEGLASGVSTSSEEESEESDGEESSGSESTSLDAWRTARAAAIGQLREVANTIKASGHPDTDEALIEINAVIANLTAEPTGEMVAELENWLANDDVVEEVCELAFDIRTPLLSALSEIGAEAPV